MALNSLLIPIEEDAVLSGDLTLQKRHQYLKRDIFEIASFLILNYVDDIREITLFNLSVIIILIYTTTYP